MATVAAGSTDCAYWGDGFYATAWDTGKHPDYNDDGIVCQKFISRSL